MTSFPLTTFTTAILQIAPEIETDFSQDDYEQSVKEALQSYSKQFPDSYTEDITGDAGKYYPVTDLTQWVEGFSVITEMQYPAATIASDETPVLVDAEDYDPAYWVDVSGTQTRYIYFRTIAPATTEAFRSTYSTPYTFSGSPEAVDVPAQDFYALVKLAACFACRSVATKYSLIGDSLVTADAASHTTKAQEFRTNADKFCAGYRLDMGLPSDPSAAPIKPAQMFATRTVNPDWERGRRFLFHRS